ncbi:hypothetical protein [Flavobacterium marginilacus]|uniref:hypothetical protein n=1 Tax=Flavobacterium marginilacus TaxID=3003256 RepID=UPI00248DC1C8|nr:hypothetical protein [Flavobacterium marginilacus]
MNNILKSILKKLEDSLSNSYFKQYAPDSRNIVISLKLEEDKMNDFKAEVKSINWNYIRADVILMYITLPDNQNKLSFDTSFPEFTQDVYTYFYPKTDFKNYLPNNFDTRLSFLKYDDKINFDLNEFKILVEYIKKDIISKINTEKFDYNFADKREEPYETKEYRSTARIYNAKNEIVGQVHKFIGNKTITGHTDCNKIDYCRITIYNSKQDKVYFINMKDLKNNSILPIREGIVFLNKRPIDLLRLEYCKLFLLMHSYAKNHNGAIYISI